MSFYLIPAWSSRGIHIELQTGLIFNFINVELRLSEIMSCRALAWIHIKFDQFTIMDQANNEPEPPRLILNAYKVSKPYVCNGLDDYERFKTFQNHCIRKVWKLFEHHQSNTVVNSEVVLFFGSRNQITLSFPCF